MNRFWTLALLAISLVGCQRTVTIVVTATPPPAATSTATPSATPTATPRLTATIPAPVPTVPSKQIAPAIPGNPAPIKIEMQRYVDQEYRWQIMYPATWTRTANVGGLGQGDYNHAFTEFAPRQRQLPDDAGNISLSVAHYFQMSKEVRNDRIDALRSSTTQIDLNGYRAYEKAQQHRPDQGGCIVTAFLAFDDKNSQYEIIAMSFREATCSGAEFNLLKDLVHTFRFAPTGQ